VSQLATEQHTLVKSEVSCWTVGVSKNLFSIANMGKGKKCKTQNTGARDTESGVPKGISLPNGLFEQLLALDSACLTVLLGRLLTEK
jgi:hypothetical protein